MRYRNGVVHVLLVGVLVACGGTGSTEESSAGTDQADATSGSGSVTTTASPTTDVPGSNDEPSGEVIIYTPPNDALLTIEEVFETQYPTIDIQYLEAGSRELAERVRSECQSGNVVADVVFRFIDIELDELVDEGCLAEVESDAYDAFPDEFVKHEPYWINVAPTIQAFMYNTSCIEGEVDAIDDLLSDDLVGRVIMPNPRTSSTGFSGFVVLSEDAHYGQDFWQRVAALEPAIVDNLGQAYAGVASGEYCVAVQMAMYRWYTGAVAGDPVAAFFPPEGSGLVSSAVALVKDGPNPAAAETFWEWVVSQDGQTLMQELFVFTSRDDVSPPTDRPVEVPEFTIWSQSTDTVRSASADPESWLADFDQIFGR